MTEFINLDEATPEVKAAIANLENALAAAKPQDEEVIAEAFVQDDEQPQLN